MAQRTLFRVAAGLACAVVLCASGSAVARFISVSNTSFRQTFSSFELEASGITTIRCPVTMEGSLHARTFTKVERTLIGYINRVTVNEGACSGGGGARLGFSTETLPWHMQYKGFEGTLPSISRLNRYEVGPVIRVTQPNGRICRYRIVGTSPGALMELRMGVGGFIDEIRFSAAVVLIEGEMFECPTISPITRATGRETVAGSTTSITVLLI